MPLGRQFKDTYWHDADGDHHAAVDMGGDRPTLATGHPDSTLSGFGRNLQGMLFPPTEATGLKGDSLAGDRDATIRTSLGLNDVDRYRSRLASMIPAQGKQVRRLDESGRPLQTERRSEEYETVPKRGVKAAKEDIGIIADALDRTDMPTHIIAKTKAMTVLDPRSGRAYAEDHSGRVRLTTEKRLKVIVTPEHTETRPAVTKGEPLRNQHFYDQVNKVYWDSYEGAHRSMVRGGDLLGYQPNQTPADTHFYHPETGEEIYPSDDSHVNDDDSDHFTEVPMHANIWPGAGKTTDKVIATPFKVYNGIRESGSGEKHLTYHTRHAAVAGEVQTVTIPEQRSLEKVKGTSSRTIVHELGHVRDRTGDQYSHRIALGHKADPIEEGIADGHADRFVGHAGQYNETLDPDYKGRLDDFERSGYGTDYHHWRGDKVGRALYAAGRIHAAMGDDNAATVPTRTEIARKVGITSRDTARNDSLFGENNHSGTSYDTPYRKDSDPVRDVTKQADTALLGHLYGEHEHVRRGLKALGMEKVGEAAHAEYQERLAAAQPKSKSQQFEQVAMPGM